MKERKTSLSFIRVASYCYDLGNDWEKRWEPSRNWVDTRNADRFETQQRKLTSLASLFWRKNISRLYSWKSINKEKMDCSGGHQFFFASLNTIAFFALSLARSDRVTVSREHNYCFVTMSKRESVISKYVAWWKGLHTSIESCISLEKKQQQQSDIDRWNRRGCRVIRCPKKSSTKPDPKSQSRSMVIQPLEGIVLVSYRFSSNKL